MPSILFVCTGNMYRSPISAAAFSQLLKEHGTAAQWTVGSAGTWTRPGLACHPDAIRVAREHGLDLEAHRTSLVTGESLSSYDVVLVMEQGHKEALSTEFPFLRGRIHMISEVVDHMAYDILDPANADVDFKAVARQLCELLRRGYAEICQLAGAELSHPAGDAAQ